MNKEAKQICDHAVEVLSNIFGSNFKTLALFGSAAREEETEFSYIGLFAIIENILQSHFQRSTLFNRISVSNFKRRVLILTKTEQEFKSYFPSLYFDLGLDGIVIYDTNDFLDTRFRKIRDNNLKNRIKKIIEQVEEADSIQDVHHIKKLREGVNIPYWTGKLPIWLNIRKSNYYLCLISASTQPLQMLSINR